MIVSHELTGPVESGGLLSTQITFRLDLTIRAVGRFENLGVPVLFGVHNLLPLVEIGFIDLPKSGGAMATPAPPGIPGDNRPVICIYYYFS